MNRLLATLVIIFAAVSVSAQSIFVNDKVQSGVTCPPVNTPGGGAGTLYTCTGDGSLYNWTGTAWNLVVAGGSTISGTIAATQVAVGSGADAIAGSADLTSSGATLTVGQLSSLPVAIQSFWLQGGGSIWNADITKAGLSISSLGTDAGATAALNVLSYADGLNTQAVGAWLYAIRNNATAQGQVYGLISTAKSQVAGTDQLYGFQTQIGITVAAVTDIYGYSSQWVIQEPATSGYLSSTLQAFVGPGAITNYYGYHHPELDSAKITNPYYLWFDSDGVYRVREDNTFNSVGQAIPTLYNPQFTKYTAGAANFERCIPGCQWNSNVAEMGNEVGAGGGNVLRNLRFIGQDIIPNPTGFFFLHQAVVTAAPAAGDCDASGETNRIVYDSTNDNLYVCSGASGWRKIATSAP